MSCAAGANGCLDVSCRAFALDGQVSAEWRRCRPTGSVGRRARYGVAPLQRSSASWMLAVIGRLSAGIGRWDQVTVRKTSLMAGPMRRLWALRHQTGAQYSAVEWTRAKTAVRNVAASAPQSEPASRLKGATRDVHFLRSNSKCQRYVSSGVASPKIWGEPKCLILGE